MKIFTEKDIEFKHGKNALKKRIPSTRFFSDWYDSVRQRNFSTLRTVSPTIADLYIARCRFDALLSKTIVLTDAQLLDGSFMLSMDPSKLKDHIERRDGEMPIIVMSRTDKLSDALIAFVKNPNKKRLYGVTFSSVENEERRKFLTERLASTRSGEVKKWKDILKIMKNTEIDKGNIERIEKGWTKWIKAQEKGIVIVKKWTEEFNLDASLKLFKKPKITTPEGTKALNWVCSDENKTYRSKIDVEITQLEKQYAENAIVLQELGFLRAWYYCVYNHALARQHSCDNFESLFGMSSISSPPTAQGRLDLPDHFWEKLAKLPDGEFKNLYFDKSDFFEKWWADGNPDDLKRALEPLLIKIHKTTGSSEASLLTNIFYGVVSSSIGGLFAGLTGAIIGGAGAPALEQLKVYLHCRPIRAISQRITIIAKERKNV